MAEFNTDQAISTEIEKFLIKAELSQEMSGLIRSSLNAAHMGGELFRWAHLTLRSCECACGIPQVALPGALAMEFFALAADILDDIQDQDNDKMPWRKLSNAGALNLAICLLMLAYEAISAIPDSNLSRQTGIILNQTGLTASDGQFLESQYEKTQKIILDQYFELVQKKSGSLAAAACKIGAVSGGAPEELVLQLGQFGINFGVMNQIRNDLKDFFNFEEKKDVLNNTKTIPYTYLSTVLKGKTAKRFKELIKNKDKVRQDFGRKEQENLRQLALEEGIVPYCQVMYEVFRQKAEEIIKGIPVPEKHKEMMMRLVEESV